MPFVESSQSLKSKLNLSGVSVPVLVGIVALSIVACILVAQNAVALFGAGDFAIEKAGGEQAGEADGAAEGGSADVDAAGSADAGSSGGSGTGGATGQTAAEVVVFVSGEVANPGVYTLAQGSRVQDAVEAAGGFSDGAATQAQNLARVLQDGEQVDIVTQEEADSGAAGQGGQTSAGDGAVAADGSPGGLVNVNSADAAALETLPGIGPSTAQKIIADRESNGPFASKEDLMRVSGIGEKKYEALQDLITVG